MCRSCQFFPSYVLQQWAKITNRERFPARPRNFRSLPTSPDPKELLVQNKIRSQRCVSMSRGRRFGMGRALTCFVRDAQPPSESRIGAGPRRRAFPQGEPSPKGGPVPNEEMAVGPIPRGPGHGREFPPLLNLSDTTSVSLSPNILPPSLRLPPRRRLFFCS